jgi:hypothetical protein
MADTQLRTVNAIVGILLTVTGALALLLWNNQQEVLRDMSGRIHQLEVGCSVR